MNLQKIFSKFSFVWKFSGRVETPFSHPPGCYSSTLSTNVFIHWSKQVSIKKNFLRIILEWKLLEQWISPLYSCENKMLSETSAPEGYWFWWFGFWVIFLFYWKEAFSIPSLFVIPVRDTFPFDNGFAT